MEEFIARTITDCLSSEPYHDLVVPKPDLNLVEARIQAFDASQLHSLTDRQKMAIRTALSQRVMILGGYAGSGKTTCLRGICDLAESFGRALHLMALSGRAAQRMAVATGRPARTIAGFLQSMVRPDAETLPPGAMVIVDEASMLDLPTLWRILKVLGDANLMLVGDPAQLPPIGFGLTFHVLYQTERIPHVVLDRVLRQSDASGIPSVAEAVRLGNPPTLATYEGIRPGVSFIPTAPEDAIGLISAIGRDLRSCGADPRDTRIIAPVKAGPAGIEAINRHFHELRRRAKDGALFPGRSDIAEGDPIIWTRNDWDRDLMNGSMGRVQSVIDGIAHVTLDGKPFELDAADAGNLDPAYAISVHKAQGSQWRRVIIPVFPSRLLDRTLIYTAITRATDQVIMLGDRCALAGAIANMPASTARSVGLHERLQRAQGFSACADYVPEAMEAKNE
ncbi:AAA family ATPase (plasmid) [Thioclava litoralis]|uniref:AAA family ATPase n=1 Tax=Thioclava litoralis TaxID=3076557 RepID=A0ABZ1E5R7_9RHOB|nr:AAA family ATPase [Thioclava sp. FTW29]